MAIFDWNHDGKKDCKDNLHEFYLYQLMKKENQGNFYSTPRRIRESHPGKACTTDGKYVSGDDINAGILVLALLVAFFALAFIWAAANADNFIDAIVMALIGIAIAIFGEWLLVGKRIIKKEAHKKYDIEDEDNNKEDL